MRRMGFRHWLMIGQTLLYVLLVWGVPIAVQHWAREASPTIHETVSWEGIGWPSEESEPRVHEQLRTLAIAVNGPAALAGAAVGLPINQVFPVSEDTWLAFALPFVPVLWYTIGCWLERRKGLLPEVPPRHGRIWKTIRYSALIASIVLLGLGLCVLVFANCLYVGQMVVLCIRFVGWPALCVLVSLNAVRRTRALVNNS